MTDREFNAGEPLGYLLTWTTYGTWLPGDKRGWWRKSGGIRLATNTMINDMARSDIREPAFTLSLSDRVIVRATIERHAAIRFWKLHAVSVRTNHVHVVVTALGYAPETVRDQLKAWCTRKLKAVHPNRQRFWTEGSSCRWLNHQEEVSTVIQYVNEAQDRKQRDHP